MQVKQQGTRAAKYGTEYSTVKTYSFGASAALA